MDAKEYGLARMNEGFPLSLRLIREIHARLLAQGRGTGRQPGEFRTSQNWIGGSRPGTAMYVPPPPERLMEFRGPFELFLRAEEPPFAGAGSGGDGPYRPVRFWMVTDDRDGCCRRSGSGETGKTGSVSSCGESRRRRSSRWRRRGGYWRCWRTTGGGWRISARRHRAHCACFRCWTGARW